MNYAVYTEANSPGNHFFVYPRMSSAYDARPMLTNLADYLAPPMQFDFPNDLRRTDAGRGLTCIRAMFRPCETNDTFHWAGWYFMNGLLDNTNTLPNWGQTNGVGVDLSDAVELTVDIRGRNGGERIEVFALGVGRANPPNPKTPRDAPYPDSSTKIHPVGADREGYVTLGKDWKTYSFKLRGRNLTNVLGGFGWAASTAHNKSRPELEFFLDNIVYHLNEVGRKKRLSLPRFIASFETERSTNKFDTVMSNVAFVYDNAVSLLAFVAVREMDRARLLADALVALVEHDRYHTNGQIRNGVKAGDLYLPLHWRVNGKSPVVGLPGWWDTNVNAWYEDLFSVSTDTGNVAWTILALLGYCEAVSDPIKTTNYLNAAVRLAEWVVQSTRATEKFGGYYGRFSGWEGKQETNNFRATEHNIDLYPAFMRIARLTANPIWKNHAQHAREFALSMWDNVEGKFWTGTGQGTNSTQINTNFIPVDAQAWAVVALKGGFKDQLPANWREQCIRFAEHRHRSPDGKGFGFKQDSKGVWFEGTAQMALAYDDIGARDKAATVRAFLRSKQLSSGAMLATDQQRLETGIELPQVKGIDIMSLSEEEKWWFYFKRPHLGATAWFVFAETDFNPFWPFER